MDIKLRATIVATATIAVTILVMAIEIRFGILRAMIGSYWPVNIPADCGPSCAATLTVTSGAAVSAAVMALTGVANVALVAISITLLWGNLKEARKVSTEASKSTAAAQEAVEQTRLATDANLVIGRQQIRAYLGTGDCSIRNEASNIKVTVSVFNSGQTPARQVVIEFTAVVMPKGTKSWTDPRVIGASRTFGLSDLAAGEHRPIERTVISKEEVDQSPSDRSPPFEVEIECTLRYRDVFDQWHTERPIAYHRSMETIGGASEVLYRKLQPRNISDPE
jgi:hypothetical protein